MWLRNVFLGDSNQDVNWQCTLSHRCWHGSLRMSVGPAERFRPSKQMAQRVSDASASMGVADAAGLKLLGEVVAEGEHSSDPGSEIVA